MTAVGTPVSGAVVAGEHGSSRWGALAGVVFGVALAVVSFMTAGEPDGSNAAKVQAWEVKHTTLMNVSVVVIMLTVIVGMYFLTWVHSQLVGREAGWPGAAFLLGAVIWAVSGLISAGLHAVIGGDAKHLSTGALQLVASLDSNLTYPMACTGVAVMFLGAGFLTRRSGLLPGWLAWVSWVFVVFGASFVLGFVAILGAALWVIVVGIILSTRNPAYR